MRLYKRKDSKYWWYKLEYHGVVYRASTGMKNRRDAEGIASKAKLDVIEGKYGIKRQEAAPLFKNAMASFLFFIQVGVDKPAVLGRKGNLFRSFRSSLPTACAAGSNR
jgi:hypothetical protein